MSAIQKLLTDHIDIWTAADSEKKSGRGRSSGNAASVYGIKKLRELILELAVRGKLVPQDTNDEPASELLKRIRADKNGLIAKGEIKKGKSPLSTSEEEKPFELPLGWAWVRLNELLSKLGAGSTPLGGARVYIEEGIPFLRSQNVWDEGLRLNDVAFIASEIHQKMSGTHVFPLDLLFNITGASIGRCAIVPSDFKTGNVSQHVTIVRTVSKEIVNFLHLVLISKHVQKTVMDVQVGVSREGLSVGKLGTFLIPIPPLAEQHRIVTKVDELMALCDQLEAQHNNAAEAHEKLVSHLLSTLTQSQSAEEFCDNWQRIAAQFDMLFSTEESIDALKQTLLQLAVMGKLVPQDPNDEPASELLKRIQVEKERLVAEGKIKKDKALQPIENDEVPYALPRGWECQRLGEIVSKLGSGSTPRGGQLAYVDSGIPFLRSQNVWNDGLRLEDIAFLTEDTHAEMANTVVYPGDILLNITGASLGRSTVYPLYSQEANVSQHVTIIRPIEPETTPFLLLCIQSPLFQGMVCVVVQ